MHVDIETHLQSPRASRNYMSPEIRNGEKYSFSSDVYSYVLMAAEYFSPNAHQIIKEANDKHERSVLYFIDDKNIRSLLEFCVDDDPMCRPSFDLICNYLFKKFIKDTPRAKKLEELIQIPRIDKDKLAQLRVLATRGSIESIVEYARYLMLENSFSYAKFVLIQGANEGDAYCRNTLNILSKTSLDDDNSIESSNLEDAFELTNHGYLCYRSNKLDEAIESLELAYSKGVTYAGYLLGLIYEIRKVKDMTFKRLSSFIMMQPKMEIHLLSLNSVFAWRKARC